MHNAQRQDRTGHYKPAVQYGSPVSFSIPALSPRLPASKSNTIPSEEMGVAANETLPSSKDYTRNVQRVTRTRSPRDAAVTRLRVVVYDGYDDYVKDIRLADYVTHTTDEKEAKVMDKQVAAAITAGQVVVVYEANIDR